MKMIRNAVMRTANGKLRPDERKIFRRPALFPQVHPKFATQIETFGSANGGHAVEARERRRLAGVFVAELAGGMPALPRKEAMRKMSAGTLAGVWSA